MQTKQQSTLWVFEEEQNATKVVCQKTLQCRLSAIVVAKLAMWRLIHWSIVERSILSSTAQFVCLKSSEKFEKLTREDELLFTMAMRVLAHRLKSAPF